MAEVTGQIMDNSVSSHSLMFAQAKHIPLLETPTIQTFYTSCVLYSYQTRGRCILDMLYIQGVWQFDKTHNVNKFLAFYCGIASLKYICPSFVETLDSFFFILFKEAKEYNGV